MVDLKSRGMSHVERGEHHHHTSLFTPSSAVYRVHDTYNNTGMSSKKSRRSFFQENTDFGSRYTEISVTAVWQESLY